ncbi:kinase-like domain-containing protein [Hyaloraphidium curvatum]|nr:kinase-like domain-containing protein [Hyaloraphidium curvatum]
MTAAKKNENADIAREVKTEVDIMMRLNHPHIIKLLDHFETKDKHYMVSELATGGDLFDRIMAKGSFNERDAAIAVATVTNAVMYLHDHDVCHRDLKPPNLLFKDTTPESPLVLVDFGVARMVGAGELMQTITGTPYFIAPEILRQNGYTKQVDLWSLGCITYTILAGYSPFQEAQDQQELFTRILKCDYNYSGPEWANVSTEAKQFIKELLTVNPAKRLTAKAAMEHPWFKKYVPAAYLQLLKELNREADPAFYKLDTNEALERRAPTLARLKGKVPGALQVAEEMVAPEEQAVPLPNLLDNIAKRRFKKAVNAVKMMRAMTGAAGARSLTSVTTADSLNSDISGTTTAEGMPMPSTEALEQADNMDSLTSHDMQTQELKELQEKVAHVVLSEPTEGPKE